MPRRLSYHQLPLLHSQQGHELGAAWHVNRQTWVYTEGRVVADHDRDSTLLFEYRTKDGQLHKQWVFGGSIIYERDWHRE
jgi:hypothetical protein